MPSVKTQSVVRDVLSVLDAECERLNVLYETAFATWMELKFHGVEDDRALVAAAWGKHVRAANWESFSQRTADVWKVLS